MLPKLALIVFGLYSSVFGLAIINPSNPAASAVLKRAPIFPGFSGDSAIKIYGVFDSVKFFNEFSLDLTNANNPSPFFYKLILGKD